MGGQKEYKKKEKMKIKEESEIKNGRVKGETQSWEKHVHSTIVKVSRTYRSYSLDLYIVIFSCPSMSLLV